MFSSALLLGLRFHEMTCMPEKKIWNMQALYVLIQRRFLILSCTIYNIRRHQWVYNFFWKCCGTGGNGYFWFFFCYGCLFFVHCCLCALVFLIPSLLRWEGNGSIILLCLPVFSNRRDIDLFLSLTLILCFPVRVKTIFQHGTMEFPRLWIIWTMCTFHFGKNNLIILRRGLCMQNTEVPELLTRWNVPVIPCCMHYSRIGHFKVGFFLTISKTQCIHPQLLSSCLSIHLIVHALKLKSLIIKLKHLVKDSQVVVNV